MDATAESPFGRLYDDQLNFFNFSRSSPGLSDVTYPHQTAVETHASFFSILIIGLTRRIKSLSVVCEVKKKADELVTVSTQVNALPLQIN